MNTLLAWRGFHQPSVQSAERATSQIRLEPFLKRSLVVLLFLGLTEACIPRAGNHIPEGSYRDDEQTVPGRSAEPPSAE
ncbi:hypothetical protein STEG23_027180, partial [Scotinomys teguina]